MNPGYRIVGLALLLSAVRPPTSLAQADRPAPGDDRAAIQQDYARQRRELETTRIHRLAKLAETQPAEEADRTYQDLLRVALESGLVTEAEPIAERIMADPKARPDTVTMAVVTNFLAETERGAYEESLRSLTAAINAAQAEAPAGVRRQSPLPLAARVSILEAYYQRLVQADQFDTLRKALALIVERSREPVIRELATSRLKQLELIGKPAPAIAGENQDGDPVSLADLRGKVVLLVFWATWCTPCVEEVETLRLLDRKYRERGFRVIGVDMDLQSVPESEVADVAGMVRRFLIDHNVTWPNLLNEQGEQDHAKAFGITQIPANVLIGRDGTVRHLDLTASNLARVVEAALAE